jgi:hypothetical protein
MLSTSAIHVGDCVRLLLQAHPILAADLEREWREVAVVEDALARAPRAPAGFLCLGGL